MNAEAMNAEAMDAEAMDAEAKQTIDAAKQEKRSPGGSKTKKRGFVMTGGGAKGLYEAGVIHAFHITNMEFDIITGSSIGAMNSVFFAEYQYRKRQLPAEVRQDPEKAVDAMDDLIKAYHHAWLLMPDKKIIDDSESGPIGKLKNDLVEFDLSLPQIVSLLWWWTDPERKSIPSPKVWPALMKLGRELIERLGGTSKLLEIIKSDDESRFQTAIRTYLHRFGMDRSLIPAGEGDNVLRDVFTLPVSPLRAEHLDGRMWTDADETAAKFSLVEPDRTLRDYAQADITVRLTRANYRTGRLEISTYMDPEDFIRYMNKQAWRVEVSDPHTLPLSSFRLQMPGNPNALNAAIASGRFPGVFSPYPVSEIYPADDPDNALLYRMFNNWMDDQETVDQLGHSYEAVAAKTSEDLKPWDTLTARWQNAENMRMIFPKESDAYLDGGAIDNTPANSAIDAAREWVDRERISKRDALLEVFIVFLHAEPSIDLVHTEDPNLIEVVGRTLDIQGSAKLSNEAVNLETINRFGQRGETLGRTLQVLLDSYQETLAQMPEGQRESVEAGIRERARQARQRGYIGRDADGILERIAGWTEATIDTLPLHVEAVKVYPEDMPLSTLQFTERLGYRQENAIEMLVMGCYNTLWALRTHLDQSRNVVDEQDRQVLELVRKWMGNVEIPEESRETYEQHQQVKANWKCQRTQCVYHAKHCPHGAKSS